MKIDFTNEQLKVLNDAIIQLPFYVAQPLINHINKEIQARYNEAIDDRDEQVGSNTQLDLSVLQ
jgi:hypothetical protein